MLRPKPSELTLTPDDVDDAFRRIARRHQSRPPAPRPPRQPRSTARPPPPRLVPGAQRSVRDAITPLGHVPLLQPQQAIIAHVDDESDSDEPSETLADSARVDSLTDAFSYPPQLMSTSTVRLPFRFGRSQRHAPDSEGTLVEPNPPPETAPETAPATPSRTQNDYSAASSPTRQGSPPPSPPSLRGGASRPDKKPVLVEEALYAPSPLRQTQVPSPAYSTGGDSTNSDNAHFLQGYFVDRQDPKPRRVDSADYTEAAETTTTYTFREAIPRIPHTEPFCRTSQPRFHSRSQSSNDAPPSRLFVPNSPSTSASEDIFWTAAEPSPERSADNKLSGRARQHSSDMSNTSLAFSYYELPDRQSSGEHSANGSLFSAQQDGKAASRHASRGTYRPFKVSDGHSLVLVNDPSAFTFLHPDQQSASPLPAEPYARPSAGSLGTRFQQVVHRYVSSDSSSREVPPDAMAATIEERASPLNVLEAQIERASHHLGEQGRYYRRSHPESRHQAYRQATGAYDSHQVPSTIIDQLNMFSSPMAMADDPYTRGVSAHTGRYGSSLRPSAAQPIPSHARGTRGRRSSENAPVGSGERRSGRSSQVQDQVSAFEQMQNAAQPRHPRLTEAPPAQSQPSPNWSVPPRHSSRQHTAPSPAWRPRMDPRLQNQENSGEADIEMMRQELQSVRMRYDEGQQGDVMDETPPRIGRVERHM